MKLSRNRDRTVEVEKMREIPLYCTDQSWFIGDYANDHGMLLYYVHGTITDPSHLVNSTGTMNWMAGLKHLL